MRWFGLLIGLLGFSVWGYVPNAPFAYYQAEPNYRFSLNAQGELERVTEPSGQASTFTYDTRSRATHIQYADAIVEKSYDPAGNLLHLTEDGSNVISRVYDAMHRVTEYTNQYGDVIGYHYDLNELEYI